MFVIESTLETKMILKVQDARLIITFGTEDRLVQSFHKIGLKWKEDGSIDIAAKIKAVAK